MKTLVIGATGFAGRVLVRRLREVGHEVSGLARNAMSAKTLADAGVPAVMGDVLDPVTVVPSLPSFDAVVFMPRIEFSREFVVVGALLDALTGTGKRFIFTSGTSMLSHKTDGDWHEATYAEADHFVPFSLAATRCDTENLVRAAAKRGILSAVIRPPLIWGYGSQRGLAALHASARSGAACYLGRGLNVMSSVHVDDLADIFTLALAKGSAGALYHAVSGETNWRSLAMEVGRLRGLPTRSVDLAEAESLFGNVVAHVIFSVCSRSRCPRTRDELGWIPNPDRLDIFAELAHPAFMAISGAMEDDLASSYGARPPSAAPKSLNCK